MKARKRHIDHDHRSGQVRGILCHHCNVMLGHAWDNAIILRAGVDYLYRVNAQY
jgi:hypothetical protein